MEPSEGDRYYTEHLVRLPNLGMFYTPDPVGQPSEASRAQRGLDPGAPVFWCGQALYKYLPRYDEIFPRIAAELGACQFVFIGFAKSQAVTDAFRARLAAAFAAAGLDAARHVVILPPMSQRDYLAAAGLADVMLDSIGWSGGKSTLDCLALDPAIVTLPGRFMRGRHTAAILRRIGCTQTIAGSLDEYVAIAVRLARDPVWRSEVRRSVAVRKHRGFEDLVYMRALEAFLTRAVLG
jgi:predicted O-linked N-acetylglucosamine transferase (SPINDLY family)